MLVTIFLHSRLSNSCFSIPVNVGFLSLTFYLIVFQNVFLLILTFFAVVNIERRFILKWTSSLTLFFVQISLCASVCGIQIQCSTHVWIGKYLFFTLVLAYLGHSVSTVKMAILTLKRELQGGPHCAEMSQSRFLSLFGWTNPTWLDLSTPAPKDPKH